MVQLGRAAVGERAVRAFVVVEAPERRESGPCRLHVPQVAAPQGLPCERLVEALLLALGLGMQRASAHGQHAQFHCAQRPSGISARDIRQEIRRILIDRGIIHPHSLFAVIDSPEDQSPDILR